jgi:timeless
VFSSHFFLDVIDWMLENLVDQTRTRRSVLKKLRELGLIFKAPTKRSTAAAAPKRMWTEDQDEKLKDLYDTHRAEGNCLAVIVEEFKDVKSKPAIIKRMIELGLIADKSEILPSRRKKGKKSNAADSDEDEDSDDDRPGRGPTEKRKIPKVSINNKKIKSILSEIEESMKESIEWLIDCLKEASEDYEEPDEEDPDNGIPLVAIMESQREALEHDQFKQLLESMGLMAPIGGVSI